MVITKLEDVTSQGSCNTLKKTPSSGKSLISTYSILGGWGGGGRLFQFDWEWEGSGVGACSRLGAY